MPAKSKSRAAPAGGRRLVPVTTGKLTQRGQTSQRVSLPSAPKTHTPWVEALIDPFDAEGVQLPDEYGGSSVPMKVVDEYTLSSNAQGDLHISIGPRMDQAYRLSTVAVGGVISAGSQVPCAENAAYYAAFLVSRVLLMGIEISYIGAQQTAAGRICCVQTTGDATYHNDNVNTMFDDTSCSGPAIDGYRCIMRPNMPPRFDTGATGSTAYLGFISIGASGLPPSTVCFQVRVVRHMEGIPERESMMRGMASVEPHDPSAMAIASNIGNTQLHGRPNHPDGRRELSKSGRDMADAAFQLLALGAPAFGISPGLIAGIPAAYRTARDRLRSLRS